MTDDDYYIEKMEDFKSKDARRIIEEHRVSLDDLKHYGMRKDMLQALRNRDKEKEIGLIKQIDFEKAFLFEAIILFELSERNEFGILTHYIPFADKTQTYITPNLEKAYQIFRKENTSEFYKQKAMEWLAHLGKFKKRKGNITRKINNYIA